MGDRVQFQIGPVPAPMALAWLQNSHALIAGVRRHRVSLSIQVNDEMLELCEALVDIWTSVASRTDPFFWTADTDSQQVVYLAKQWLEIGSLSDDELKLMGCTWAPEWTRPFADALVVGVRAALDATGDAGADLSARLLDNQ
jgi:hypothetical protein